MEQPIENLVKVAHLLADAADEQSLAWFRQPALAADNKDAAGYDPVTQADRAAEQAMRDILAEYRPDDAILGEEFGGKTGTSGLTWVLDPIDGTRAYVAGTPTWGTLIGVGPDTGPTVGIVSQPYIGERFVGAPSGARLHRAGQVSDLYVSQTTALSDAIIFTTFPEVGTPVEAEAFHAVASKCRLTRYGMDCYAYALLAAGHIDLVIEAGLNPYDIHGPIAVIKAAGGVITTWDGGPAHLGGRIIAAATRDLHAAACEILERHI